MVDLLRFATSGVRGALSARPGGLVVMDENPCIVRLDSSSGIMNQGGRPATGGHAGRIS